MSAIRIAVVNSPVAAARNAVRHGLSGSFYVPDSAKGHVAEIREEIKSQFRIEFFEGEKIVEEMAICRWQVFEADRLLDEAREREIAEAGLHYDRFLENERAQFHAIVENDPERGISLIKQNLYGNDSLITVWAQARQLVNEGLSFYSEILKRMVVALGSHWAIDRITHDALKMVALCMAVTPRQMDVELMTREWFGELPPDLREAASRRLAEYRQRFGEAIEHKSQLLAIIEDNISELTLHKDRLEQNLERSINSFAAAHAGHGMLNPILMKEAALLQRYRTRAQKRFEKLETKLQQQQQAGKGTLASGLKNSGKGSHSGFRGSSYSNDGCLGRDELEEILEYDMPREVSQPVAETPEEHEVISILPNKLADDSNETIKKPMWHTTKSREMLFEETKNYSTVNFRIGG